MQPGASTYPDVFPVYMQSGTLPAYVESEASKLVYRRENTRFV